MPSKRGSPATANVQRPRILRTTYTTKTGRMAPVTEVKHPHPRRFLSGVALAVGVAETMCEKFGGAADICLASSDVSQHSITRAKMCRRRRKRRAFYFSLIA